MFIKKALESYVNLYIPIKREKFGPNESGSSYGGVHYLITFIVYCFAIYLSVRCNNGFNLGSFLLAFFCAPCYIIYHLATSRLCGLI